MYCKKCKYHASDNVSVCPKCGTNWNEERKGLSLNWLKTGKWTSRSAVSQAGASRPPAISSIFQTDSSSGINLEDLDEFSDDFLQAQRDSAQNPAQSDAAPFPPADFSADTAPASEKSVPLVTDDRQTSIGDNIPEIDFSTFADNTFQVPPPQENIPTVDQRDLTIPGLEEMLEQIATENFSTAQSTETAEDDIKLDFSSLPEFTDGEDSSGKKSS